MLSAAAGREAQMPCRLLAPRGEPPDFVQPDSVSSSVPRNPWETFTPVPSPPDLLMRRRKELVPDPQRACTHPHTFRPSPHLTAQKRGGPSCCLGLLVPPRPRGIHQFGSSSQMFPRTGKAQPQPHRVHRPSSPPQADTGLENWAVPTPCHSQGVAPASTPSSPCRQPKERFEVRCLLTSSHSWLGADPA